MTSRFSLLLVLLAIAVFLFVAMTNRLPDAGTSDVSRSVQPDPLLVALVEASPCDIVDLPSDDPSPGDPGPGGGGFIGGIPTDSGYLSTTGGTVAYIDPDVPLNANLVPDSSVVRALTDSDSWENEAHDCQRLILESQTLLPGPRGEPRFLRRLSFGPLVGLFPLVPAMEPDTPWTAAMPVATVYSWGDWSLSPQGYGPLAIADGWNCLWMRHDERGWHAAIAATDVACPEQTVAPTAWPLHVRESVYDGDTRGNAVYPETTRWAWNPATYRQYIGIKCGAAWCSIGDTEPPVPAHLRGDPYRTIPGWSDSQLLALVGGSDGPIVIPRPGGPYPVPGGPNLLMPGPLGSVYPDSAFWNRWHPRRTRRDLAEPSAIIVQRAVGRAMAAENGLVAARIELTGTTGMRARYSGKFGLVTDAARSRGAIAILGTAPSFTAEYRGSGTQRAAVTFVPGRAHSARGAVRWRWQEDDEKVWVSCENGCCTVQPI